MQWNTWHCPLPAYLNRTQSLLPEYWVQELWGVEVIWAAGLVESVHHIHRLWFQKPNGVCVSVCVCTHVCTNIWITITFHVPLFHWLSNFDATLIQTSVLFTLNPVQMLSSLCNPSTYSGCIPEQWSCLITKASTTQLAQALCGHFIVLGLAKCITWNTFVVWHLHFVTFLQLMYVCVCVVCVCVCVCGGGGWLVFHHVAQSSGPI